MSETHDFDAIWREAGPMIWRSVYTYAGGRRDVADDAVGEAFARVMSQGEDVRDPVPYLYRVAFRVAAAELKRPPATPKAAVDPAREDAQPVLETLSMLADLSPSQRAAIYLHYRVDLPVAQVARIMGTTSAAVRVHLSRGRRRLAALIEDQEVER